MRTTTFGQAAEALSPRRTTQADWLARSTTTFSVVGDDLSSRSSPRALGCLPKGGSSHVPSLLLTAEAFLRSGRIPGPANVAKYHYERPHVDSDPPPPPGSIASARGEYAPSNKLDKELKERRARLAAEREAVDKALIQQKVELDRMKQEADEAKKSARRGVSKSESTR